MKLPSPRRRACCCSSPRGVRRPAPRYSTVARAASAGGWGCSPLPPPQSWSGARDCCRGQGSVPSSACAAAPDAGKGVSTTAGRPSRSTPRSRCCAPVGGCGCGERRVRGAAGAGSTGYGWAGSGQAGSGQTGSGQTGSGQTGSGLTPDARPGVPIGRCAASCAVRLRRPVASPHVPQGLRAPVPSPPDRDGGHAAAVLTLPERELSTTGPVYRAHDAHTAVLAWEQESRSGRRA